MRRLVLFVLLIVVAWPAEYRDGIGRETHQATTEQNPRLPARATRARPSPRVLEGLEAILACIRRYEGGYRSVNPAGPFYGSYQFLVSTWDGVARRHALRWVGVRPDRAPLHIQDRMAAWLYREQGLRPWPTPSRKCR